MALTNEQIADEFEHLADLLEFQGANPFRVRAYRNGARVMRGWLQPLASRIADPDFDPRTIEGVGDAVAEKLVQLVRHGSIEQLEELRRELPAGVLDLLRVPGMGPKRAATLYRELGIDSLESLGKAARESKIRSLKGFGPKLEASLLHGLDIAAAGQRRMLHVEAETLVEELRAHLQAAHPDRLEVAGSFRRGKETVGDLDWVAVTSDPPALMDQLASFGRVAEVLARGDTKISVRLEPAFQVDLRIVPANSFGSAMVYFTGSQAHNIALRSRAKHYGLRINEWGVFLPGKAEDNDNGEEGARIAGTDEDSVYRAVGWPWIPPELREARLELVDGEIQPLPELIDKGDLRGDLHMHTTATDGTDSIEAMATAAREAGLGYIAITDHSQRVAMARGLNAVRLREQWREVDHLDRRWREAYGFRIFKGIECDILEDGRMDLPDDVLAEADWVLAAIHYGQQQSREQITDRILNAIRHPSVDAIAHPTGRLLLRREPYDVDLEAIFQACVEHGKALELNANPHRLDLDDIQLSRAVAFGIPIVIDSDAHSISGLGVLRHGIVQARRGGLTATHVLNTRTAQELEAWCETRRRD